jgi:hypothetical protein
VGGLVLSLVETGNTQTIALKPVAKDLAQSWEIVTP